MGRAAGLIFGVGTMGSLAGIYLTTFILLDRFGTRATILFAAGALLAVAAIGLWRVGTARARTVGPSPPARHGVQCEDLMRRRKHGQFSTRKKKLSSSVNRRRLRPQLVAALRGERTHAALDANEVSRP